MKSITKTYSQTHVPILNLFLIVITLMITANAKAATDSWHLSVAAGTMPSCLFSDSGLGSNESIMGRTYCQYGVSTTLRSPYQNVFLRAGRSILSASDSQWDGDQLQSGLSQSIQMNSLILGKEFSVPMLSSTYMGLGIGGFKGRANDILQYDKSGVLEETNRASPITGLALYAHIRVNFYTSGIYSADFLGQMYQFQTKQVEDGFPARDMLTLPSAEISWGITL